MRNMPPQTPTTGIQVITRLHTILDALAHAGGRATLKTLAAQARLAPSTTFRILAAAIDNDFVARDGERHYILGSRLPYWAQCRAHRIDLREIARPIMEWLRDHVQETVNLTLREGDEVVYVERAISPRIMRVEQIIGSRAPLHVTAVGKLMLSQGTKADCRAYAQRTRLPVLTPHTLNTVEALWRNVCVSRELGYALDNEEAELGVGCMGVLLHASTTTLAGLSISAPRERRQDAWIPLLQEAARRIDTMLASQRAAL